MYNKKLPTDEQLSNAIMDFKNTYINKKLNKHLNTARACFNEQKHKTIEITIE